MEENPSSSTIYLIDEKGVYPRIFFGHRSIEQMPELLKKHIQTVMSNPKGTPTSPERFL